MLFFFSMMRRCVFVFWLACGLVWADVPSGSLPETSAFLPAPVPEEALPSQKEAEEYIQDKKRYVDQALRNVYEHAAQVKLWEGIGFFLVGGISTLWGLRDQKLPTEAKPLILYGAGGLGFLLGIVNLASRSEDERVYRDHYQPLPESTYREMSKKVIDGEGYLRYLAEKSRYWQMFQGVTFTTLGVASALWYASLDKSDRSLYAPLMPFGVVMLGLGAYSFYAQTYAESEWVRYVETWKNKNQHFYSTLRVSVLPQLDTTGKWKGWNLGLAFAF